MKNTFTLEGFIGQEVRIIDLSPKIMGVLSVANNSSYKDKDGEFKNTKTKWIEISFFGSSILQKVKKMSKGDKVIVDGVISEYTKEVEGINIKFMKLEGKKIQKIASLSSGPYGGVVDSLPDFDQFMESSL